MTAFSPGLAQGCFELLDMVQRRSVYFQSISTEFSRLGIMPAYKVAQLAQALNWLEAGEDGAAVLTVAGSRIVACSCYEQRIRQALLDYIDIVRPPWLQNATFGRARVLAFTGQDIRQVFVEAGLADGTDKVVVAFWDEMAARARGQKGTRLNDIGREGERRTIAHERERTGREPKWISIDNNADGYDVLSVCGPTDARLLSIEVKATTLGLEGSFHLTANEWERSLLCDLHAFHLWDLSRSIPNLAVLSQNDLDEHIPGNRGNGIWESVQIPFKVFASKFFQPSTKIA